MITNADQGILLSLEVVFTPYYGMVASQGNKPPIVGGFVNGSDLTTLFTISNASISSQVTMPAQYSYVGPAVQAQDGSYYGEIDYLNSNDAFLAKFDHNGNLTWSVPGYYAQIATADGGVIAQSYSGASFTFDSNGNQTGQLGSLPTQSWAGNQYKIGSVERVQGSLIDLAASFWAFAEANASGSSTAAVNYEVPQGGLQTIASTDLTAQPACNQFLGNLTQIAISNKRSPGGTGFTKAALLSEIQQTASGAMSYIYDGPSSTTLWNECTLPGCVAMFPVWFTGFQEPPGYQVKQIFQQYGPGTYQYLEGLSQYNGYAIWLRVISDWSGAWMGAGSQYIHTFSLSKGGQVNSYGLGTLLHEVLHKNSIGGGFTHENMSQALDIAPCQGDPDGHNTCSVAIANRCFPNN
jgi:hypothetical protein